MSLCCGQRPDAWAFHPRLSMIRSLISSCAAPGLLGKLTYGTNQSLKVAAKTVGGKIVGRMFTGLAAQERAQELPDRARGKAAALAPRLC